MNILVACERYGRVRDALRERGHNAISCDFEPSARPGPHFQCDVRPLLRWRWDMVIAHPPCQFLALSGVQYLHKEPGRFEKMKEAAEFFLACLNANAPRVAVENPTMHRYALDQVGRRYDFAVHPHWFGDPAKKRTCWWVRGLPPLLATEAGDLSDPWAWHTKTSKLPKRIRAAERSRTFPGTARAIALQWG